MAERFSGKIKGHLNCLAIALVRGTLKAKCISGLMQVTVGFASDINPSASKHGSEKKPLQLTLGFYFSLYN